MSACIVPRLPAPHSLGVDNHDLKTKWPTAPTKLILLSSIHVKPRTAYVADILKSPVSANLVGCEHLQSIHRYIDIKFRDGIAPTSVICLLLAHPISECSGLQRCPG